jgi:hypothetical protein
MKKVGSNSRMYHEWTTDFCKALESEHEVPPDRIFGEYAILKLTNRYMRINMIAFLFIFGLAAFLIVGGMRGSLHLRTHRMFTGRRLSGLRRSYAVPVGYKTTADSRGADETTRYTRKTVAISILILVMLSVIIIGALSTFIH